MAQEVRETSTLIGSDKVDGTAIYGAEAAPAVCKVRPALHFPPHN